MSVTEKRNVMERGDEMSTNKLIESGSRRKGGKRNEEKITSDVVAHSPPSVSSYTLSTPLWDLVLRSFPNPPMEPLKPLNYLLTPFPLRMQGSVRQLRVVSLPL